MPMDDLDNVKSIIKSKIIQSGYTMSDVIQALNKKYHRQDSVQNLSNKLNRGTLKYKEVLEIAEVIGYTLEFKPKNESLSIDDSILNKISTVAANAAIEALEKNNSNCV